MRGITDSLRRIVGAGGLSIALLAAGCAACADQRCGVDPDRPRLGAKSMAWLQSVLRLPSWEAQDIEMRSERVAEFGRTWWGHRGVEMERTGHALAASGPWIADEFTERGALAGDWFVRGAARVGEDVCCVVPRWWHTIKLAAE